MRRSGAIRAATPMAMNVATPSPDALGFALSTDYGVFLLDRIREGRLAGMPDEDAIVAGYAATGRLITAAAILFAIAIGSFVTSSLVFIKALGLGVALAVLIDATIVRALVLPATMQLLGRWNWWPGGAGPSAD